MGFSLISWVLQMKVQHLYKKNLNRRLTWHPDENMELPGSFNFGILSECNWSQKLLYLHISYAPPSVSHQSTLESVSAGALGNRKSQQAPPFFCVGYCEKRFINLIYSKALTLCTWQNEMLTVLILKSGKIHICSSHMILVVTMLAAHTVLIYNKKDVLPYWSSDHS